MEGDVTNTDAEVFISNVDEVQEILDQIPTYSVKELRELIAFHAKKNKNVNERNCADGNFLEKDDMRKKLKEVLLSSLSEEELLSLNNKTIKKTI